MAAEERPGELGTVRERGWCGCGGSHQVRESGEFIEVGHGGTATHSETWRRRFLGGFHGEKAGFEREEEGPFGCMAVHDLTVFSFWKD